LVFFLYYGTALADSLYYLFLSNGFRGGRKTPIVLLARSLETQLDGRKIARVPMRISNGAARLSPFVSSFCATHTSIFSDYNYVPDGNECTLAGPESIPAGQCLNEGDRFWGSSGYRKIPGNTCDSSKGLQKDKLTEKDCSEGSAKRFSFFEDV
jgi:hypothetical protein